MNLAFKLAKAPIYLAKRLILLANQHQIREFFAKNQSNHILSCQSNTELIKLAGMDWPDTDFPS